MSTGRVDEGEAGVADPRAWLSMKEQPKEAQNDSHHHHSWLAEGERVEADVWLYYARLCTLLILPFSPLNQAETGHPQQPHTTPAVAVGEDIHLLLLLLLLQQLARVHGQVEQGEVDQPAPPSCRPAAE
ncbi:hypothetical protein O3P69_002282 [Scylla paramamosain]|uniref:Uncharacterized protein n=1 Tax=Scylla paramamosain TaxID=85552 RepID=A0AAW0V888_SCYPA